MEPRSTAESGPEVARRRRWLWLGILLWGGTLYALCFLGFVKYSRSARPVRQALKSLVPWLEEEWK